MSSLPNFNGLDDAGPLPFPLHTVGTRYRPTGEQRLMLAVLCDALHLYASARARHHTRRLKELRGWFASDDRSYAFSFNSVCEALGLDAAGIRRRVLDERAATTIPWIHRVCADRILPLRPPRRRSRVRRVPARYDAPSP